MARGTNETDTRVLRSDFLLVTFPGLNGRMSFRDVFEVDSRAVRDTSQADRLVRLFGDAPPDVCAGRARSRRRAPIHLAHIETDPSLHWDIFKRSSDHGFVSNAATATAARGPPSARSGSRSGNGATILRTGADKNLSYRAGSKAS